MSGNWPVQRGDDNRVGPGSLTCRSVGSLGSGDVLPCRGNAPHTGRHSVRGAVVQALGQLERMMAFSDLLDKAKSLFGANKDKMGDMADKVDREKIEDMAEKAVDKVDDMTGGKVPDAVKDAVDKIDGEEG